MCSNKNHKAFKEVPREKSTRRWARSTNFREMKKKTRMLTKDTRGSFHLAAYRGETEWDSTGALKNTGLHQFIQRQESKRNRELTERANEKQWGSLYAQQRHSSHWHLSSTNQCHSLKKTWNTRDSGPGTEATQTNAEEQVIHGGQTSLSGCPNSGGCKVKENWK